MDIRPIRTEEDYRSALADIDGLMAARPGTPEGDRLDILVTLVEAYEKKAHPLPPPDPVDAILFRMEQAGLTPRDLEPLIGEGDTVARVLDRRQPLTLPMIRNLSSELGIPADILVQPYDLDTRAA